MLSTRVFVPIKKVAHIYVESTTNFKPQKTFSPMQNVMTANKRAPKTLCEMPTDIISCICWHFFLFRICFVPICFYTACVFLVFSWDFFWMFIAFASVWQYVDCKQTAVYTHNLKVWCSSMELFQRMVNCFRFSTKHLWKIVVAIKKTYNIANVTF